MKINKTIDDCMVLAGDIGGTKTILGLFKKGKSRPRALKTAVYATQSSPGLGHIVSEFLDGGDHGVSTACFGIAGPVVRGVSRTTNIPWTVSEDRLRQRFGFLRVRLLNDLATTALAIPLLRARELAALNTVRRRLRQPAALVAPGTGLGQALLLNRGGRFVPVPSEGGHADFAPTRRSEVDLWRFLRHRHGHVSNERLLSGPGLVNIYQWLKDESGRPGPDWLAVRFNTMDTARAISEAALGGEDPLCDKALDYFVSILGAVSGNLALIGLTTGGVYLGGGIPPKILPRLQSGPFMTAFTAKGRFKPLLETIPVRVILNSRAALLGAAQQALTLSLECL